MDWDDLQHDSLVVLCLSSETENIAYIWKGICFEDVSVLCDYSYELVQNDND